MLPFQTEWSYQDRLIQCNLLPISYWHEMMDLAFLYKAINGFIDIDRSILPTIRRFARVTRSCHTSNATTYTTKRCRTLTYYQRSFFIRTSRIWNSLPTCIRDNWLHSSVRIPVTVIYYRTMIQLYLRINLGNSLLKKLNLSRTPSVIFKLIVLVLILLLQL